MKHIARRLLCLLLAVALCAGMICVTAAASTEELPPEGSLARKVVDSCEYTLDLGSWSTVASEGGAGHLQGICTDDKGNYLYASFTNMLVKVDGAKMRQLTGTNAPSAKRSSTKQPIRPTAQNRQKQRR